MSENPRALPLLVLALSLIVAAVVIVVILASPAPDEIAQTDELMTEIPPGEWLVGVDIEPGSYGTDGGGSCHWEVLSGDPVAVTASDKPVGKATVELVSSDVAFRSEGCGMWVPRRSLLSDLEGGNRHQGG